MVNFGQAPVLSVVIYIPKTYPISTFSIRPPDELSQHFTGTLENKKYDFAKCKIQFGRSLLNLSLWHQLTTWVRGQGVVCPLNQSHLC